MTKAEEMATITEDAIKQNFNLDLYNLILQRIEEEANKGNRTVLIIFHNCNSNYLKPYIQQLRKDGFFALDGYIYDINNANGMCIDIRW